MYVCSKFVYLFLQNIVKPLHLKKNGGGGGGESFFITIMSFKSSLDNYLKLSSVIIIL